MVRAKSTLGGIPVGQAMLTDFRSLSPRDSLSRAAELIVTGSQQDFPVVDNGAVVGVLTRGDLLAALPRRGQAAPVGDVMRPDVQSVDYSEMLEDAFARLQTGDFQTLPVIHGGQLVGLVTADNVREFLMIRSALGAPSRRKVSYA